MTETKKEKQVDYFEHASRLNLVFKNMVITQILDPKTGKSFFMPVFSKDTKETYGFTDEGFVLEEKETEKIPALAAGSASKITFLSDLVVKKEKKEYKFVASNLKKLGDILDPTLKDSIREKINNFPNEVKTVFTSIDKILIEEAKKAFKEFEEKNQIKPVPADLFIDKKVWNTLAVSLNIDKYVILLGPKGCGKTQTAQALAKAYQMEYVSFNMGAAFKPKQMFCGMLQAEDGSTKFIESEFLKAFQNTTPTLIFLDEITRTPQTASNYLMTILDRNQSYIYIEELGKRVYKGSGVKFIAAGNIGSQYTDTRTMDGALWDRFTKVPVDYLPFSQEMDLIIQRAPKAAKKSVEVLIKRAQKCRDAEKEGSLQTGISTRQLIDMAHYLENGLSLEDVYEVVFLNNFINGNNDEIKEAKQICQSV